MIDNGKARNLAKELIELFDSQVLHEHEPSRIFFCKHRETLDRALDDSTTPETFKVAVVGSFKVGKSSFVNALCGIKGLASVKANPETAAISVLRYSERPFGEAHLIRREQWDEMKEIYSAAPDDVKAARYRKLKEMEAAEDSNIRVDELERSLISNDGVVQRIECDDWEAKKGPKHFTDKLATYVSRNNPLHYFVDFLSIHVPVPFLKDGIELIDTPGLDDPDLYRVLLTEEYVKQVDAILFLTRSGSSYSQSDKDFIVRQLRRKTLKHLRVVVTRCDETFVNACKDAEDRDEEPPTYETHIALERKRVRTELDRTLDELLVSTDVAEEDKGYFREQLADISLDFISSRYHTDDDRKSQSGIDVLHHKLLVMLQKLERVAMARGILTDAIRRVCERTKRFLDARLESVGKDFSHEKVQQQLTQVSTKVQAILVGFEGKLQQEVRLLTEQSDRNKELVAGKIDAMLVHCDTALNSYAVQDIAKHWKTRRCGGWGHLGGIQTKVADTIFPHVELLLNRFVTEFRELVARTEAYISGLQRALATFERENQLGNGLQPVLLTERFAEKGKTLIEDVASQIADRRTKIVRHLDSFVSSEVQSRLERARRRVTRIVGVGTTSNQNVEVDAFYVELKQSLQHSLGEHLRAEFASFAQLLQSRAESIYPKIKQDLDLVIEDRINAIQSGLTVMNDQQKRQLLQTMGLVASRCKLALEKTDACLEDENSTTDSSNEELSVDQLMLKGESSRIEFKSTLRINLHTGKADKVMEHVCLKTIAAFLNSHGGHLVIGVADDGTVLGIEADGFPNTDKMNLHLVNLIKDRMGPENMLHIDLRFESLNDKTVLVVRCKPSNVPVYLKDGKNEQFFTRTGAATSDLLPSQVQAYIQQRF